MLRNISLFTRQIQFKQPRINPVFSKRYFVLIRNKHAEGMTCPTQILITLLDEYIGEEKGILSQFGILHNTKRYMALAKDFKRILNHPDKTDHILTVLSQLNQISDALDEKDEIIMLFKAFIAVYEKYALRIDDDLRRKLAIPDLWNDFHTYYIQWTINELFGKGNKYDKRQALETLLYFAELLPENQRAAIIEKLILELKGDNRPFMIKHLYKCNLLLKDDLIKISKILFSDLLESLLFDVEVKFERSQCISALLDCSLINFISENDRALLTNKLSMSLIKELHSPRRRFVIDACIEIKDLLTTDQIDAILKAPLAEFSNSSKDVKLDILHLIEKFKNSISLKHQLFAIEHLITLLNVENEWVLQGILRMLFKYHEIMSGEQRDKVISKLFIKVNNELLAISPVVLVYLHQIKDFLNRDQYSLLRDISNYNFARELFSKNLSHINLISEEIRLQTINFLLNSLKATEQRKSALSLLCNLLECDFVPGHQCLLVIEIIFDILSENKIFSKHLSIISKYKTLIPQKHHDSIIKELYQKITDKPLWHSERYIDLVNLQSLISERNRDVIINDLITKLNNPNEEICFAGLKGLIKIRDLIPLEQRYSLFIHLLIQIKNNLTEFRREALYLCNRGIIRNLDCLPVERQPLFVDQFLDLFINELDLRDFSFEFNSAHKLNQPRTDLITPIMTGLFKKVNDAKILNIAHFYHADMSHEQKIAMLSIYIGIFDKMKNENDAFRAIMLFYTTYYEYKKELAVDILTRIKIADSDNEPTLHLPPELISNVMKFTNFSPT